MNLAFSAQKIVHGSLGRGFCRVFSNENVIVVAFRGTRERHDWALSNLRCIPEQLIAPSSLPRPMVHSGFQQALHFTDKTTKLSAFDAALHHIQNRFDVDKRIIVTGHSLGGALAILFAVKMALSYPNLAEAIEEVVTFGSPSVGLSGFQSLVRNLGLKVTRIVNENDGVPFTPPILYRHVGAEFWMSKSGVVLDAGWRRRILFAIRLPPSLASDHNISEYVKSLTAIAA